MAHDLYDPFERTPQRLANTNRWNYILMSLQEALLCMIFFCESASCLSRYIILISCSGKSCLFQFWRKFSGVVSSFQKNVDLLRSKRVVAFPHCRKSTNLIRILPDTSFLIDSFLGHLCELILKASIWWLPLGLILKIAMLPAKLHASRKYFHPHYTKIRMALTFILHSAKLQYVTSLRLINMIRPCLVILNLEI